jgi:hypothetical protein
METGWYSPDKALACHEYRCARPGSHRNLHRQKARRTPFSQRRGHGDLAGKLHFYS